MKEIDIAGVPVHDCTYDEVLDRIDHLIKNERKVYVVTPNPEMVLNANRDEEFMDVLKGADLATPDGIGILWAAKFLKGRKSKGKAAHYLKLTGSLLSVFFNPRSVRTVLRERVTGTDLLKRVVDQSQKKEWRIFLLGASKGVANDVISRFKKVYPKAHFVGSYSGSPEQSEEEQIQERINEVKPDILFVAYGSPQQEFWIYRNLFKLDSVKVAIGVGGAFDFYAGKVKRAPKFFQKAGLEWFWRLTREPKRIARIWNATFVFIKLISRERLR